MPGYTTNVPFSSWCEQCDHIISSGKWIAVIYCFTSLELNPTDSNHIVNSWCIPEKLHQQNCLLFITLSSCLMYIYIYGNVSFTKLITNSKFLSTCPSLVIKVKAPSFLITDHKLGGQTRWNGKDSNNGNDEKDVGRGH